MHKLTLVRRIDAAYRHSWTCSCGDASGTWSRTEAIAMAAWERHARTKGKPASKRDPFAELCSILREVGAQLTFHGVPVSEQEMRAIATRSVVRRIESRLAPPLAAGPHIDEHW